MNTVISRRKGNKNILNIQFRLVMKIKYSENSISKCDSFPSKNKKSRFFIFGRKNLKLLHYGQKEL